jgi:hypothetical protein
MDCWPRSGRGRRRPRPHDGTIIPERPNLRWGTDATMAWTRWAGWASPTTPRSWAEPETNGCAERWTRTLKEQCLWAELHNTVDQLRQAVAGFVQTYNSQWLIGRLGHRTPKEAYQAVQTTAAA